MRAAFRFYHPKLAAPIDRAIEWTDRFSREQIWWGLIAGYVAAAIVGAVIAYRVMA